MSTITHNKLDENEIATNHKPRVKPKLVSWIVSLCYTLRMEQKPSTHSLMTVIKNRGWEGAAHTLLDVIEPIAPLVSQFLWVVQPVSTIWNARDIVGDLAQALDEPNGVNHLRDQLNDK